MQQNTTLKLIKICNGAIRTLLNEEQTNTSYTGYYNLRSLLSNNVQITYVYLKLKSELMISVGHFWDDNCKIILKKKQKF